MLNYLNMEYIAFTTTHKMTKIKYYKFSNRVAVCWMPNLIDVVFFLKCILFKGFLKEYNSFCINLRMRDNFFFLVVVVLFFFSFLFLLHKMLAFIYGLFSSLTHRDIALVFNLDVFVKHARLHGGLVSGYRRIRPLRTAEISRLNISWHSWVLQFAHLSLSMLKKGLLIKANISLCLWIYKIARHRKDRCQKCWFQSMFKTFR